MTVTCTTCSDEDLQSLIFHPFKTWSKEDISGVAREFEQRKGLDYFKHVPLLRLKVCVVVQRERISILPIIYVPTPVILNTVNLSNTTKNLNTPHHLCSLRSYDDDIDYESQSSSSNPSHRRMTRSCSGHARSRMVWVG